MSEQRGIPDIGRLTRTATENLASRRYVAAGERACVIGTADGDFPPLGWRITGQMGGVWAYPLKLLDGMWFSVDGKRLSPASRFTTGCGVVQLDYPPQSDLQLTQTIFVPAPLSAALFGLSVTNPSPNARIAIVSVEFTSHLILSYPWDLSAARPADDGGSDRVRFMPGIATLIFTRPAQPWTVFVRGSLPASDTEFRSTEGRGAAGRLTYEVEVEAGGTTTLWMAVAGSHLGFEHASRTVESALRTPEGLLRAKVVGREALLDQTTLDIPDPELRAAWDWAKLNLADCRLIVREPQIRYVDEGKAYPEKPTLQPHRLRGLVGGYPDSPHFFGAEGAYTAFVAACCGQWDAAMDHLRTVRDVSRAMTGESGKVVHEIVGDGSVVSGSMQYPTRSDDTSLFALAVHALWRWSGDSVFRTDMLDFVRDGLHTLMTRLNIHDFGYPAGSGIMGHLRFGDYAVDVVVTTWRALLALADMADHKGETQMVEWARSQADALMAKFDQHWWMRDEALYANSSANPYEPGANVQDYDWSNVAPMQWGIAPPDHAIQALERLESAQFTGGQGLYHTGLGRDRTVGSLANGGMAVAEAHYGRVNEALRYMRPVAGSIDLEMPGALPEVLVIGRPELAQSQIPMVMGAWSAYAIVVPLIEYIFGIQPDAGRKRLTIVPQIPSGWSRLALRRLRVGQSELDIAIERTASTFTLRVEGLEGWQLTLGCVVPEQNKVRSVGLDGRRVEAQAANTLRGETVQVELTSFGQHTLIVRF